jgi:hypothetical protein
VKLVLAFALLLSRSYAQVYSPSVLLRDQPDPTNLERFASTITHNAGAKTPREKAEAIWRYFLTDGRFVEPGFWYHIAGWTYEEPAGEVLDPLKLLNSYGFGLCYHIAPLLEAVFEAAGFPDARVWFLTGHTVAEVYYDGGYHYFDSDMMGYNVVGAGAFQGKPVASVRHLEQDPAIILGKLSGPKSAIDGAVDTPWYPADLRAAAMKDLAALFTSTTDNYLFPFTRHSSGHDMSFTLRPGEKLIRFFEPESPSLFYLPYKFDGKRWREFPSEVPRYGIRTANGPRSQKDHRSWATGRIEYSPTTIGRNRELVFDMPSPWVIIDAEFRVDIKLESADSSISIETSSDGRAWLPAGEMIGPFDGTWNTEPQVVTHSANGRLTAVSGSYGYLVRLRRSGPELAAIRSLTLTSRIQLNPRTLPALSPGENQLAYASGPAAVRKAMPLALESMATADLRTLTEQGQTLLCPSSDAAEKIIELDATTGFDFGARFVEIRNGLAPDKLTAETRVTGAGDRSGAASIHWSTSPQGPWREAWTFPADTIGRDGETINRVLAWPDAFVSIRNLPAGSNKVYVRVRTSGPCADNVRAAVWHKGDPPQGKVRVTHSWTENNTRRQHTELISAGTQTYHYQIKAGEAPRNESVTFEAVEP